MSIRVHPSMNAVGRWKDRERSSVASTRMRRGGKRANWCDYSGVVDGTPVGLAVFDHLVNPPLSNILARTELRTDGNEYLRRWHL